MLPEYFVFLLISEIAFKYQISFKILAQSLVGKARRQRFKNMKKMPCQAIQFIGTGHESYSTTIASQNGETDEGLLCFCDIS